MFRLPFAPFNWYQSCLSGFRAAWQFINQISTAAWLIALSFATLGLSGLGMELQHLLRLSPCPYCIFQRVLYLTIGVLALLAFIFRQKRVVRQSVVMLIALAAVLGAGVAAYQSVMQFFPGLLPECGFSAPNLIERFVDVLGMKWPSWFLATGFCSSREWSMFYLSMANWSLLCFIGTTVLSVWLYFRPEDKLMSDKPL